MRVEVCSARDEVNRVKVFIGLTEVAGYYRGLKRGFDELGIACTYVNLDGHAFQYDGAPPDGWLVSTIQKLRQRPGPLWRMLNRVLRLAFFVRMLLSHDIFIFGFATSFIAGYKDLPILRWFNKTIIYQFHGSDSRPPYLDGSVMASDRGRSTKDCVKLVKKRKATVQAIDRWADAVIDIPPTSHFHQRPVVQWLEVGLPCRPAAAPEVLIPEVEEEYYGTLRILHSPSHPEAKGTAEIRAAVKELAARGYRLELVEVSGQPNAVVLAELARSDFVVDQLYADYGMPGFATEAAWFGKPVIIGGYARALWEQLLPPELIPPTHYCHPSEVAAAIELLAVDHDYRLQLGRRARAFVEQVWSPRRVAERYLQLASRQAPERWTFEPTAIRYWQGCALSEARARALIAEVVAEAGVAALGLGDKPELEALLVEESRRR
jgi:glycosyltransferase involved in cell wall biosynthesis